MLERRSCDNKTHRFVSVRSSIPSIPVRNATYGDHLLRDSQTNNSSGVKPAGSETMPTSWREILKNVSCLEEDISHSMVLKLQPPPFRRRSGNHLVSDTTFEMGSFMNTYARYIKYKIEAPPGPLAYGIFVSGHCLPDPPGHMYVIHYNWDVGSHISRNFCLNLEKTVTCASTRFQFIIRVRVYIAYYPSTSWPRTVTFTPKGAYNSMCPGQ